MSYKKQKEFLEKLKRFERKFDSKEASTYKMFLKRHKDDEDLDSLSMKKLEALYNKYYTNRKKKSLDGLFKTLNEN